MLTNYHTHSTFCDGKNTPEEIVLAAIEQGFDVIGLSGHGHTYFDVRYCMRKEAEVPFRTEVRRLQQVYGDKIKIHLGSEEDIACPVNRSDYEYIIGSCHYTVKDGKYYPIDSGYDYFTACLEAWGGDAMAFAEDYYTRFCDYIVKRKPDIVGHFDLITKFDEKYGPVFLGNPQYEKLAAKFTEITVKSGCVIEVNTGAISRGYRNTPYPHENLLHIIKKEGGRLVLNSDSHSIDTLDFHFNEARQLLKDVGIKEIYHFVDGTFVKENI